MTRVVDTLYPVQLGMPFRWLVASSWVSNLGDGISRVAGPLLIASLTDDPFLVSIAITLEWLPSLMFALPAGAVVDRVDRRLLAAGVDAARAVVLVVLVATILTGGVSIGIVLGTLFLLSTTEVFGDSAAGALLPSLVARDDLAIGNARLQAGFITLDQLVGPPIGAALFALGHVAPFAAQASTAVFGAMLMLRVRTPPRRRTPHRESHLGREILEGIRWTWHNPAVRALALTGFTFNITYGAAWSVLVLYTTERLGLAAIGFGLVTTVMAAGGLVGTGAYGWITRRVSLGNLMRIGLIIETLTHLGLALTTSPSVAVLIFFAFGAHAFIWHTTSTTVRQRAVPENFQGRVRSVYLVVLTGGLVIGAPIGGVFARCWGLAAPFWFAFGGSALLLALLWHELRHIAHDDTAAADTPAALAGPGPES